MAKPILNEARAEQNLAEPSIECNVKYELSEELLKELCSNSYSGRVEEDVIEVAGSGSRFDTAYWSFLEHGYTVSSLMDTAYWSLE
ncbi:hypothetical protein Tco_0631463 [Tanacetum coccineum]